MGNISSNGLLSSLWICPQCSKSWDLSWERAVLGSGKPWSMLWKRHKPRARDEETRKRLTLLVRTGKGFLRTVAFWSGPLRVGRVTQAELEKCFWQKEQHERVKLECARHSKNWCEIFKCLPYCRWSGFPEWEVRWHQNQSLQSGKCPTVEQSPNKRENVISEKWPKPREWWFMLELSKA